MKDKFDISHFVGRGRKIFGIERISQRNIRDREHLGLGQRLLKNMEKPMLSADP